MARIEVTVTRIRKACPYCKERPLIRKTCGHPMCQFKHHVYEMRKDRKTEQVRTTRIDI